MSLFNFFKKKKKVEKKKAEKKEIKKVSPPVGRVGKPLKKKKEVKPKVSGPKKKVSGVACRVLSSPHITEKATALSEKNKYVFKVLPKSNKIEVKKAIEDLYGVDVINVRIINIPRRKKRLGKQTGWTKGYKKAIVKVKEGQKIEVLPR